MSRPGRCVFAGLAVVLGCIAADPALAPIGSTPDPTWVTNGSVDAVARLGDTVFIGGNFTQVGPRTGPAVGIDAITGRADPRLPEVAGGSGTVKAVAADGVGGWFIGGSFKYVAGLPRDNIAHIRADRSVDPGFTPNASSEVDALAVSGTILYVGGRFGSIGGQIRHRIAALDAGSGQATPWDPNADGEVDALAVSGTIVYVGGRFTQIGTQTRNRIAAIDAGTGGPTPWNPDANGAVLTLAVSGSTVYAGGQFTSIGSATRNYIAALDAGSGQATPWDPHADGEFVSVNALAVAGSTVYAGGHFTQIGGEPRNHVAELDAGSGQATPWDPHAVCSAAFECTINALTLSGSTVYAGGNFTSIGGGHRNNVAALEVANGQATPWDPNANQDVLALALWGSTVYAGGTFTSTGGQDRSFIAAIDARNGQATPWDPHLACSSLSNFCFPGTGGVRALALSGSTVYVGGHFDSVGGVDRMNIGAIDAITGLATPWDPHAATCSFLCVRALAVSGSTVYAGGDFRSIGGADRNFIAALDATTGQASPWDPDANSPVLALAVSGPTVYAGGFFNSVGGEPRNRIAALDADSGHATPWNPNANAEVGALAISGATVYAGGSFTSIGGLTRSRIAGIDAGSGTATPWNPSANNDVSTLAVSGSTIYAGGVFTSIGGGVRNTIAGLDAVSGLATPWDPHVVCFSFCGVRALAVSGPTVYAGGLFTGMGITAQQGIASFSEPPAISGLPVLSGVPEPGQTLTTTNGTWAGSTPMSFAYAWLRDGTPIGGETGSMYVVRQEDRGHALSSRVTATNLAGSASATSEPVNVAGPRSPLPRPKIVRCWVPRVVGLRLPTARRRIRHAHCRVGRVRYARSRAGRGRVIAQRPRSGPWLRAGSRVNLTVSQGRRR